MTTNPGPRISYGGHNAWRVRVAGKSKTFTFRRYGGEQGALEAAREWRNEQGKVKPYKLTAWDRQMIRVSRDDRRETAARYGISVGYVDQLRRQRP